MMMMRTVICGAALSALLMAGCQIHSNDNGKNKDFSFKSPFGGMDVRTDKVDVKDTGFSRYPGATEVTRDDNKDHKAHVNMSFPGFSMSVVALKYESQDTQDKVWDYYKHEMSQKFGRVLECRPGSKDLDLSGKDELTCRDGDHDQVNVGHQHEDQLRAGSKNKMHIVAFKKDGSLTQFALIYLTMNKGNEGI